MPRLVRRILSGVGIATGALLALTFGTLLVLPGCFSFDVSEEDIASAFASARLERPEFTSVSIGGRTIRFARAGNRSGLPVVLVHGSPGSWDDYLSILTKAELREDYDLFAVDRPGFGGSDPGQVAPSMKEQARLTVEALRPYLDGRSAIWVGHSLGGPLIVRAALDSSETVAGLVLVAPSVDPELERIRWYNEIASWRILNWALPRVLVDSNREILPLKPQLEQMDREVDQIGCPILVIQGRQDELVPAANADYVERRFVNAEVEVWMEDDMNHFVPWTHPGLIVDGINWVAARSGGAPE